MLRWFLVVFFSIALVVIVGSWWRNKQACTASCVAQGLEKGDVRIVGGGRLGMRTECVCANSAAGK